MRILSWPGAASVIQQIVGAGIACGVKGFQVGVHENLRFDVG